MPPFQPRTSEEIRREMMAQLVAQTPLTDVEEGGVAHTIMGVVASEIGLTEQRILSLYQSFGFGGSGTDLDDRVAQLPGFVRRGGPVAASGSVMRFTRSGILGALTVPAGVRVQSRLDSSQQYITVEPFTFAAGQGAYPAPGQSPVRVVALSLGSASNAPIGSLNVLVSSPDASVTGCTNTEPLTNGSDTESDESLRKRAFDYFASLAQTTPRALEFLALSFQASDGTRARFAFVVSDPGTPAYAVLVVDDGSGMSGLVRAGNTITSEIPLGGMRVFWFNGPAASTPTVTVDGVVYLPGDVRSQWVFAHEQGLAYIQPGSSIFSTPGDTWSVSNYQVYTGFIAELQDAIEGVMSLASRTPGWKPAGGRVRVMPPVVEDVDIGANIVVESGFSVRDVRQRTTDAIVAFFGGLPPGEPLRLFDLYSALDDVPGLLNVVIRTPSQDLYPSSPFAKLYTRASRVNLEV